MKIWMVLLTALCLTIPAALVHAECRDTALAAVRSAKHARGIVSDLDLMKAWFADVGRQMENDYDRYGNPMDLREAGFDYGVSWMWWTDSFDGFMLCESSQGTPVDLDRSWWGAYGRVHDHEIDIGYELFYLSASDGLSFRGDLEDYEYAWDQRIAGASLWYSDWARVSAGTIDIAAPTRTADALHEGSVYLNLGIPRFGLGADIVTQPGSRRLNTAILSVRQRPLPWAGLTANALAGWLDDEGRTIAGFGLSGLSDTLSVQILFEGLPVRFRSTVLRIETEYSIRNSGDEFWARLGVAPYVEVSAFNAASFEELTDRRLVPGVSTGARAFWLLGWTQVGLDGFVGYNRATELDRIAEVADRVQWGARFYVRIGL